MKKILTVTLVMVFVLGLMGGVAGAFPEDGSVGQPYDEDTLEGVGALSDVTRVQFCECEDGWYLIMPFRGDFGGDPYLDDGWIINVWTDRNGNAWVYIFVSEDDPRFEEAILWGSWDWFLGTGGGSDWQEDSGVFVINR